MNARIWTRESAIEWLQAKGKQVGRAPTFSDMHPYHMTFHRLFGSIAKAQKAAGFEPRKPGRPRKEEVDA